MIQRSRQMCFPRKRKSDPEDLLINCVPLFVNKCVEIPYSIGQLSMKRDAICDAVVLDISTAIVNFEQRYLIISTYRLTFNLFGSGSKMSIATNSNWPLAGDNCKERQPLSTGFFRARPWKFITVVYMSFNMSRQYDSLLMVSYIRVSPGCTANVGCCWWYRRRGCSEVGMTFCIAPSMGAARTRNPLLS